MENNLSREKLNITKGNTSQTKPLKIKISSSSLEVEGSLALGLIKKKKNSLDFHIHTFWACPGPSGGRPSLLLANCATQLGIIKHQEPNSTCSPSELQWGKDFELKLLYALFIQNWLCLHKCTLWVFFSSAFQKSTLISTAWDSI